MVLFGARRESGHSKRVGPPIKRIQDIGLAAVYPTRINVPSSSFILIVYTRTVGYTIPAMEILPSEAPLDHAYTPIWIVGAVGTLVPLERAGTVIRFLAAAVLIAGLVAVVIATVPVQRASDSPGSH